jgi:anti-sigma factor RsiW
MALTCQQAEEWIEQSLEGNLAPRDERSLQRHLQECARCRQRYCQEKRAADSLRSLPTAGPPAGLCERVMASLPSVSPRLLGRLAGVLQRAAADADLRQRLRENPHGTLLAMHIALPPGMRVEVVSEQPAPLPTPTALYLPLPEAPLQIAELEQRMAAMGLGPLFGFWW